MLFEHERQLRNLLHSQENSEFEQNYKGGSMRKYLT